MKSINKIYTSFSQSLDRLFLITIYILIAFSALMFPLAIAPGAMQWIIDNLTAEKIFEVVSFSPGLYNWLIKTFLTEALIKSVIPFLDYGLDPVLVKEAVCKILILFLLQLMIFRVVIGSEKIRNFGKGFIFILLFILYAVFSTFYITPTFYTAFKQLMLLITFIAFFYIIYSMRKDKRFVEKVLLLSIFLSLILSLISIIQYLNSGKPDGSSALGFIVLHTRAETYRNSVGSFIGHNTGLSVFIFPNLLMCLIFLYRKGSKLRKIFIFITFIAGLITLFIAQSRAIWILAVIFIPVTFYIILKTTKRKFSARTLLVILSVILIILLLIISQTTPNKLNKAVMKLSERLTHFTPAVIKEGTRWCIINVSIPMIKKYIFAGSGLSSFPYLYLEYQGEYFASHPDSYLFPRIFKVNHSHNEYLQLIIEFGVLGVIILLLGIIPYLRDGFKCIKEIKNVDDKLVQIGLGIIMVVMLIQSSVDFPWHIVPLAFQYTLFFSLFASGGFTYKCRGQAYQSPTMIDTQTSSIRKIFYFIIFISVIILSIYFQIFSAREVVANSYLNVNGSGGIFLDQGFKRLMMNPDDEEGMRFVKRGKEELIKGLRLEPLNKEGVLRLAIADLQLGNVSSAIDYIYSALEEYNPKEAYNTLANCYYRIGDMENAKKWFKTVIYYVPRYVEAMEALAKIYLKEGNRDEAIKLYKQMYKWDEPYFYKNIIEPAFVSYNTMRFNDVTEKLNVILNIVKENPDYYFVYAKALAYTKKYDEAEKIANLLSEKYTKEDLKEYVMGDIYFVQKKWEDALLHYQKAFVSQPKNFDLCVMISIAYKKMGEDKKAEEYKQKAYEISEESPEVLSAFGKYYYFILGEKEEGIKYFIQRINYPNMDIVLARVLADYYIDKEEYAKAKEVLQHILDFFPYDKETNQKLRWMNRVEKN